MQLKQVRICFDVDSVLARPGVTDYSLAKPYNYAVKKINNLYDLGYYIIFLTARYMIRCDGSQEKARDRGRQELIWWLDKHGVKYHEVYFGKPSSDIYVDDKAFHLNSEEGVFPWFALEDRLRELRYG